MEHTYYLIAWKCQTNGRIGRSTNPLTLQEAERLAARLNQEHPQFQHVPVPQTMDNFLGVFAPVPQPDNLISLDSVLANNGAPALAADDEETKPEEEFALEDDDLMESELHQIKEA